MSTYLLFRIDQAKKTRTKAPIPQSFCYRCEKPHNHTVRCVERGFCVCACGSHAFFSGRRPS